MGRVAVVLVALAIATPALASYHRDIRIDHSDDHFYADALLTEHCDLVPVLGPQQQFLGMKKVCFAPGGGR